MERLQKILAAAGVASRRAAEELIRNGRVRVNGEIARIGQSADAAVDMITVDGHAVRAAAPVYLAMNKPVGYACTRHDPHLPQTVYQLLPREMASLYTVGRLDVSTEGLLLLTNDGDWANNIAHPSTHVPKTYLADVEGEVTREVVEVLRRGVDLEDGRTQPASARVVWERPSEWRARLQITITEGRNRQVRRMLAAVGLRVLRLQRTAIGPLNLGAIPSGAWRELTSDEVKALRRAAQE